MSFRTTPSRICALAASCLIGASSSQAGNTCGGSPFANVIRPRAIEESADATIGPQIFDTAYHPRGFLLMGNNLGLLSYDGVSWRLMPLGRSSAALSVAVAPDGRMFAGGTRTFGEVVEDPTGQLLYQPLESRLAPADRNFSDVWQTIAANGVVYFRSPERLVELKGGNLRVLRPAGRFSAAGVMGGVLYAHDTESGIVAVGGGTATAVAGGAAFRGVRVTSLSPGEPGSLLVGAQDQGLFTLDPKSGRSQALSKTEELRNAEILSVRRLANGQIAVGTLRAGLFMLGPEGALRYKLDRDTGLPDNAVLSLQTVNGSLWAGTSGGVAQLLVPSPVQNYGAREGLPGLVESMALYRGSIYAATSEGVFRLSCGARAFEPVPGLRRQSFALFSADSLLAATADGIYEINSGGARLIRPGLARGVARSLDLNRLWVASQTGIGALVRRGTTWAAGPDVTLTSSEGENWDGIEATSVAEDQDGRVVAALVTGQVISGLPETTRTGITIDQTQALAGKEGVAGGFAQVMDFVDGVRVGTAGAVLRPQGGRLVADRVLSSALGSGKGAFRIKQTSDGAFWVASAKRPLRLSKDGGGLLSPQVTALLRIPGGSRILDFLEVSNREVWVGTDDGAYRYDPMEDSLPSLPTAARIRRVVSGRADLFSGGPITSLETAVPYRASLRFLFSSTSLDDPSRNRFRYRLDGTDEEWSPWSTETRKDYTNLGSGAHEFIVETQDVYGRRGAAASFSFVVLAPWYEKPLPLFLGAIVAGGLFLGALNLRTHALRKRQRELEAIVEQKTAELREASFTDALTGLRNRRYFAEVVDAEVSLAGRPGSSALHMFLIDLDHFKQVNDTFGHAAGDQVLRETAGRLRAAMRTSDLLFRWGGEEFLIMARGAAELPRSEIANRIVRMMSKEAFDIGTGTPIWKTCSVGFATYPFYSEAPATVPMDTIIELADLALYRAKKTGRNRAVGVSPRSGSPAPGEIWKNKVLENLEKAGVAIEVLEGPATETA